VVVADFLGLDPATLTALAGLATGIAACITAWGAVVKARHEADEDCQRNVAQLRRESEEQAQELHRLRMERA
jgi:hypothetical protein